MLTSVNLFNIGVFLLAFAITGGLAAFLFHRRDADSRRAIARLRGLAAPESRPQNGPELGELLWSALMRLGSIVLPGEKKRRANLQARLTQAGIYHSQGPTLLLGAKSLLTVALPIMTALPVYLAGILSYQKATLVACAASAVGIVLPGLWLDSKKKRRQSLFRRSLPDALDMLVLCLEGGVSLTAALSRVTSELQTAHPLLAAEFNIVQREIQLGLSAGEALNKFGQRCDLEEVRNLASVLLQSERFGASVVKALRIHADSCRQERQQRAEETAQKAAVKILFPTLLCIFPAIFIVVLGPAAYQMSGMFNVMK